MACFRHLWAPRHVNPRIQDDTWKLLKKYRDVVWSLELSVQQVRSRFEIEYGSSIEDFLESVYVAGIDLSDRSIEHHAKCIERSHRMLKLLDTSIDLLRTKHKNGENYYWLLYYSFLSPQQLRNVEDIIEKLRPHIRDISFHTYYRRRREAIDALSSILWGGIRPKTVLTFWRSSFRTIKMPENRYDAIQEIAIFCRYTRDHDKRNIAENLLKKLRELSENDCRELICDIQKGYHLPWKARTVGEMIAVARQESGAQKLEGHDIMALERFDPEVKHMIVFDVLSSKSPIGDKRERMRLFLTESGYQKALEIQSKAFIQILNHAGVIQGHLRYDRTDRDL